MKRIVVFISLLFMVIGLPVNSYAALPGHEGGIKNEYEYREMVFITGKPILLSGTVKESVSRRRNTVTTRYTFTLENIQEEAKLSRSLTMVTTLDTSVEGQVIENTTIDRASETITIGEDKYKLTDYIFSKSRVIHQKPVADFFSSNWTGKKIYTINRNEGTVTIQSVGEGVGYENYWSSTQTHTVENSMSVARTVQEEDGPVEIEWEGDVRYKASASVLRDISYVDNQPSQISFRGGYLENRQETQLVEYEYDLPRFDGEGIPDERKRIIDECTVSLKTIPTNKRLYIQELKDVSGHWAENDIRELYSLGVFDDGSPYFGANLPMLRADFTRAIVKAACFTELDRIEVQSNSTEEEPRFYDVGDNNPNRDYIYQAVSRGIIKGIAPGQFNPDGRLTRAQAITIIIRALGFENLAPTPGYSTGFADDGDIPYWAKDAIYVAKEIGLVKGDAFGNVMPNEIMSRAEAAAFINRFIKYLRRDIVRDYRERILYY